MATLFYVPPFYRIKKGERLMTPGTFVILVFLIGIVALIIRSMVRDKKNGKSIQCGGDCGHCGGYCHQIKEIDRGDKRG